MNKTIVILLITGILSFLGIMAFLVTEKIECLTFAVIIVSIGTGILSTLVERKSKSLFYGAVIITIIGCGIIAVYQGYAHPLQINPRGVVSDLGSFYMIFMGYLFNNTYVAFSSLLGGPTIVFPYLNLSTNIATTFTEFATGIVAFYGYKGAILILGWLNAYPELTAVFLSCIAGIRIALETFKSFMSLREEGFKNSMRKVKDAVVFEIVNTMPKVMALLLIAAVLETLWTPFWINYWFQHIL